MKTLRRSFTICVAQITRMQIYCILDDGEILLFVFFLYASDIVDLRIGIHWMFMYGFKY